MIPSFNILFHRARYRRVDNGVAPNHAAVTNLPFTYLTHARMFFANYRSRAATYGPITWYAPIIVLGAKAIDFIVVQYTNDVALEDCQEIEIDIESETRSDKINVVSHW
jgi:ureidoglycolate hydrolase